MAIPFTRLSTIGACQAPIEIEQNRRVSWAEAKQPNHFLAMMSSTVVNLILLSTVVAVISSGNVEQAFLRGVPTKRMFQSLLAQPCLSHL